MSLILRVEGRIAEKPLEQDMEDSKKRLEDAFHDVIDPSRVQRFLGRFPELEVTLIDTARVLREHFPGSELLLRHEFDPEYESQGNAIIAVRTDRSPKDALKRLGRFDEEWWLQRSNADRKKISIILESI